MSIPVSHVADSVRHSASDAFSLFGLGKGAARVKYAGGLQKKKHSVCMNTQNYYLHNFYNGAGSWQVKDCSMPFLTESFAFTHACPLGRV